MELSQWIIQTNQLLQAAQQDLPEAYVQQLRMFQQTLMLNHLQSGFLTLNQQTPLERAIAANPFENIGFATRLEPTKQPLHSMQSEWEKMAFDDTNVVDHDVHPDSPRRNRPAYLDDPKEQFQHAGAHVRPLPTIDPNYQKDWAAKPTAPPPKDWSVLGR